MLICKKQSRNPVMCILGQQINVLKEKSSLEINFLNSLSLFKSDYCRKLTVTQLHLNALIVSFQINTDGVQRQKGRTFVTFKILAPYLLLFFTSTFDWPVPPVPVSAYCHCCGSHGVTSCCFHLIGDLAVSGKAQDHKVHIPPATIHTGTLTGVRSVTSKIVKRT